MLALGDINSSMDVDNNDKGGPASNAIIIHQSKCNQLDINASFVEGGDLYAEIDGLIGSFVQLEKDHRLKKKDLIDQISNKLFALQITDVKANSQLYNSIFLIYAKYELGMGCSFKIPYNIEKYKTDYGFEQQLDSATTELNPYIKLKYAKPGK